MRQADTQDTDWIKVSRVITRPRRICCTYIVYTIESEAAIRRLLTSQIEAARDPLYGHLTVYTECHPAHRV